MNPTSRTTAWILAAVALLLWCGSCRFAHAEIFALQPGNEAALKPLGQRGSTRITEKELKLADGLTIRGRRNWPLSFWAENVATCRKLGKPYTLLLMGGDAADPTKESHLAAVEKQIKQLAALYAGDPLCWGVHVTGCSKSGHSEELYWGRPMPPKVIAANKRLTSAWAAAFPTQRIILAGSANDQNAIRELIKHGVKIAPGRFVYKMNAMSPKPNLSWAGNTLLIDAAKLGADIGYEALQPSNHQKFGGTWAQFVAKTLEIERRAGEKFVYEAIYRYDLPKARLLAALPVDAADHRAEQRPDGDCGGLGGDDTEDAVVGLNEMIDGAGEFGVGIDHGVDPSRGGGRIIARDQLNNDTAFVDKYILPKGVFSSDRTNTRFRWRRRVWSENNSEEIDDERNAVASREVGGDISFAQIQISTWDELRTRLVNRDDADDVKAGGRPFPLDRSGALGRTTAEEQAQGQKKNITRHATSLQVA